MGAADPLPIPRDRPGSAVEEGNISSGGPGTFTQDLWTGAGEACTDRDGTDQQRISTRGESP